MRYKSFLVLLAAVIFMPSFLYAADFDGAASMLCSVRDVVDCSAQGECIAATPEEVDVPAFFKVDFAAKQISAVGEENIPRTSPIKNFEQNQGRIIIQGAENGRAWSLVLSEDNGEMSATVSEENYGLVLFGVCVEITRF